MNIRLYPELQANGSLADGIHVTELTESYTNTTAGHNVHE